MLHNFFPQISGDSWHGHALPISRKCRIFFFSSNDRKQSQSPKIWWEWISDGWWWKNLSIIFHLKLLHNFFHQIIGDSWHEQPYLSQENAGFFFSSNDDKQSQSPKNWWRWISDGWWWKLNHESYIQNCRAISFIKSVWTAGTGAPYLSQENTGFFFLIKWLQTKSKSKKLMKMNLRWMMMKKSIMNFSFKIAAQFLPSNQWGQLARARFIYLKKMPDFFSC